MAKNFKTLQAAMKPEVHARAIAQADQALKEMTLNELREARHITQTTLAKKLKKGQPAISKLENSVDMYISSLHKVVSGMGGVLDIRVIFPDGVVRISQFSKIGKPQRVSD